MRISGCETPQPGPAGYPHRRPSVSTRLSQRSRLAFARAADRAFRHRRWSSLRDASRGSVSGGSVRPKSPSMAISNSHRRTGAHARSTRPPEVLPTFRSSRHSTTSSLSEKGGFPRRQGVTDIAHSADERFASVYRLATPKSTDSIKSRTFTMRIKLEV